MKIYTYRMGPASGIPARALSGGSWREGDKTRNVHLESARKMDAEVARQKARERKAEGLAQQSFKLI